MTSSNGPAGGTAPMVFTLISGDLTRLHVALSLAATSAASGRAVTLFVTGEAVDLLSNDTRSRLRDGDGRDFTARRAHQDARGIADLDILLDALAALPVRLMVCDAALHERGIDPTTLITRPAFARSGMAELVGDNPASVWLSF